MSQQKMRASTLAILDDEYGDSIAEQVAVKMLRLISPDCSYQLWRCRSLSQIFFKRQYLVVLYLR